MNKDQKRINEALKLLSPSYNIKANVIKINTTNTIEHEICKTIEAYNWIKDGYDVYTEAIFKNGGRCDLFVPSLFLVVEILHTETTNEVLTKKNYYPSELNITWKTTKEILKT